MNKTILVLAIALLIALATAGTAFANFGPHGGYSLDTDACAGCHRAHTSFSTVTWEDTAQNDHSALLVSSASTIEEFCYACHGADAPGASTNVELGVFDSGPSGADNVALGGGILYQTNSTFNGALNGGAFSGVTSMHDMDAGAVTDPMWGEGMSGTQGNNLTCTGCHDVHGSSNYRLLKDALPGDTVGGYDASDVPQPFVFSSEEGYPVNASGAAVSGGWLKHEPGSAQMVAYRPNYTNEEYQWAAPAGYSGAEFRSISTWCAGCHDGYNKRTGTMDYDQFESSGVITRTAAGTLTASGGTEVGAMARHRHPVDVAPWTVTTANGWGTDAVTSTVLPLERRPGAPAGQARGEWTLQDYLGCLTCHVAHGTEATMTGWANARLVYSTSAVNTWSVEPTTVAPAGVNPNVSSSLLRTANRGVCERCHNK